MVSQTVVAGNWKMNLGPVEAAKFARELKLPRGSTSEVILFPPALSLAALKEGLGPDSGVALGVQNVHWEEAGAFTGEISVPMAMQAGATFVLVGHSERRHVFGEADDAVSQKVEAVLSGGLTPVLCVGETLEERKRDQVAEVILRQLEAVLGPQDIRSKLVAGSRLIVAYEPVWAIGTGETATPADASRAHGILRDRLRERLGDDVGEAVPILYGGSVKPDNAGELLAAPEVNGVLVGGASLDPASFAEIVVQSS